MPNDIEYRLEGQESIVHGLHHNLAVIKYLTFELHQQSFDASTNVGLAWICRSLMADLFVDYYKLIKRNEKFSFEKILNIAANMKINLDYLRLRKLVDELQDEYSATPFEKVRSNYIAHQDINVPAIKTDLMETIKFNDKIVDLFRTFCQEFNRHPTDFSDDVVRSLKEVFDTIDEYERVKAFLIAEQIKGKKLTPIAAIAKFTKS